MTQGDILIPHAPSSTPNSDKEFLGSELRRFSSKKHPPAETTVILALQNFFRIRPQIHVFRREHARPYTYGLICSASVINNNIKHYEKSGFVSPTVFEFSLSTPLLGQRLTCAQPQDRVPCVSLGQAPTPRIVLRFL